MTEEELKYLREASDMQVTHWVRVKAADEIEQLAKRVGARGSGRMKTALEYTIDLERELNMDGLDERAYKMPHTHDNEAYVTITGSMIIERHIKNIMKEAAAAEADKYSFEIVAKEYW